MKTVIVLAMHGAPPNEVSQREVIELVGLHQAMEHTPPFVRAVLQRRYRNLDAKIRLAHQGHAPGAQPLIDFIYIFEDGRPRDLGQALDLHQDQRLAGREQDQG